jgi:hypothetical protein
MGFVEIEQSCLKKSLASLSTGIRMLFMVRRWLICGLLVLLCASCIVLWVVSYLRTIDVVYVGEDHTYAVGVEYASVYVGNGHPVNPLRNYWEAFSYPADHWKSREEYENSDFHFLGFAFARSPFFSDEGEVHFPFWFPTTISGMCLWLAWKKRRVRNQGKAFPVEPATTS